MWSQNVDSLEFRVYRVKDPILFFQKMEDVHRLGTGQAPRERGQITPIERFHSSNCARAMRFATALRGSVQPGFARGDPHLVYAEESPPAPPATSFSGLPLLNPQQVVSVWQQNISTKRQRWESESIPIPVSEKGLYLVEAAHGDLRAYTIVNVTNLTIVTKTSPGRVLFFVTDRANNSPVPRACPLAVWANKQEIGRLKTDPAGLADFKVTRA